MTKFYVICLIVTKIVNLILKSVHIKIIKIIKMLKA